MTVEEVLKQSGMTDEQVKALDANVLKGFTTILSTASQSETAANAAREAAERAERAQKQMYSTEIAPALDAWATEKANKEAEIAFYRTQAEQAKLNGFVPKDAPTFNAEGAPVATPTPGSPLRSPDTGKYLTLEQARSELFSGLNVAFNVQNEYQRLYGTPMPDSFMSVVQEAGNERLPADVYAAKKYNFAAKRAEIETARQTERDNKIRQEAVDATKKEMAEKYGAAGNPMLRPAAASQFTNLAKATVDGQRKDPLKMNREERHRQTTATIAQELATNTVQ